MQSIQRRFANLWRNNTTLWSPPSARNLQARRAPAEDRSAPGGGNNGDEHVTAPATPARIETTSRVIELANPWGSADPTPPENWCSQHYSPTATTFKSVSEYRLQRAVRRQNDPCMGAAGFTQTSRPFLLRKHREEHQTHSSTKRKKQAAVTTGERDGSTTTAPRGHENKPTPCRHRRRTCPADSSFVSPMKRSTSQAPYDTTGTTSLEDDTAYHNRLFIPSHLVFRPGCCKGLAGKGRASNRFKRRTTFNSAYPAHAAEEPAVAEESTRPATVTVEAVARTTPTRSAIEDDPMWERLKRREEEAEEEANKRGAARRKRINALRAENLGTFASAALCKPAGVDLATLRDIFAGETPEAADLKDDANLVHLEQEYMRLEKYLGEVVDARVSENGDELERLLSLPAVSRLQTQAEVKRAIEVNRLRQQQAVKAATPKSADDARQRMTTLAPSANVAVARQKKVRR